MKTFKHIAALAFFTAIVSWNAALAQSPNGYWIIESNVHVKDLTIVRFYNNANEQIYEEKLNNVALNIQRKKTVKQLNAALDKAMESWIATHKMPKEKNLVAAIIKK